MKIQWILLSLLCFLQTTFAQSPLFQYISPKPHSILNSRETNIIIRQGSKIDRSTIRESLLSVAGSESGLHHGALTLSDDDKTLLFHSFDAFTPHETVTVRLLNGIITVDGNNIGSLEFSFKISPLKETLDASIITNSEENSNVNKTGLRKNSFVVQTDSLPADFPTVTIGTSHNPSDGKIFIANKPAVSKPPYGNYILIAENNGKVLKYKKFSQAESNFKVLPNGELAFSENGRHIVTDTSLTPIDTFKCGNGYTADSHDFLLLANGHSLLFAYDPQPVDMSQIVPGGRPDATVIGTVIQELDASKNVIFQWRSWDYISITSSFIDLTAKTVDYAHGNALEVDKDENIFIVMRHTSNIIKINRQTGNIEWILGGKQNEFTFINEHESNNPNYFSYPHNMTLLPDGNITLFDNGDQHVPMYSRGVEYKLDEKNKTATLIWEYRHSPDIYTSSGGSTQRLPNGNRLIGWGRGGSANGMPTFTEVHPDNSVALELFFPDGQFSYRCYKFPWVSQTPQASVAVDEVLIGNTYTFNHATDTTGITIIFQQLNADMYNRVLITKYNYAPVNPDFIGNAPLMASYFFKVQGQLITSYEGEVHVELKQYHGISMPQKTVVYARPLYGEVFIPLPTSYDSVKNELVFTTSDFGDFAFGIPQSETAYSPVPIAPKNNEIVNGESSVKLQWATRGIVQTYHLQVAADSTFTNLIVNASDLTATSFTLDSVTNKMKYFWRINNSNSAGTSEWSNISAFRTASPFITITYPNGSGSMYIDSTYIIRWQTNLMDSVKINLLQGTNITLLGKTTASKCAFQWKVPANLQAGSSYKLNIVPYTYPGLADTTGAFFSIVPTGVEEFENGRLPNSTSLSQNYPNPFNPSTVILYSVKEMGLVRLAVYDLLGREVAVLVNGIQTLGQHQVAFSGSGLTSGLYFYKLESGGMTLTKKMTLLK